MVTERSRRGGRRAWGIVAVASLGFAVPVAAQHEHQHEHARQDSAIVRSDTVPRDTARVDSAHADSMAPMGGRPMHGHQHEHQPAQHDGMPMQHHMPMRHDMPAQQDTGMQHDAHGQHDMAMSRDMSAMQAPLGIPMTRRGSGTAWVPDVSPMYGVMLMPGRWMVMLHGAAFLQYTSQSGERGDEQFGSINWGMAMAQRRAGGGRLTLRGMLSAEPATVGAQGYPLLLQSGESYRGTPLHDRQHPHDLFMELGAQYEHEVTRNVGVSLYVAPVGEPASGPVAYMHRPSAINDPFAPIGHHWQDATHISFGVVTAGVFTRTVQLEGSVFNGREPDEHRYDFDFRRLDSYTGRVTVNPSARWSVAGSFAYLASPEASEPDESQHRATASVLYGRPVGLGTVSTALVYGGNRREGADHFSHSGLAEANWTIDERNAVFGRAELAQKDAHELVLPSSLPDGVEYNVGAVSLGYVRELVTPSWGTIGLGVRGTVNRVPAALETTYGTRTPLGGAVFLRVRPPLMRH